MHSIRDFTNQNSKITFLAIMLRYHSEWNQGLKEDLTKGLDTQCLHTYSSPLCMYIIMNVLTSAKNFPFYNTAQF